MRRENLADSQDVGSAEPIEPDRPALTHRRPITQFPHVGLPPQDLRRTETDRVPFTGATVTQTERDPFQLHRRYDHPGRRQLPAGSAPCADAIAEHLPFEDQSFDAATALSTVHHWGMSRRGRARCSAWPAA
ncbi:methyltransferase domain-containing protein [Streptomyces sp. NPDC096057]|uniref:methyltransferase domain-containing protein n=1 Tax=Streptomyces sp. NPDC096057 TaxID=3155543 RepID=UPI003324B7EE